MLTGARFDMESDGIVPDLAGVSETMLWSLHNRASEARRPDSALVDPKSVHTQSAINYDFAGHFGVPLGSLAARAVEIDRALRSWLDRHAEGIIISLGEGLETQSGFARRNPSAGALSGTNPPFPPHRSECARPCLDGRGRALVRRFHRGSGLRD
jgi:hypothetical protein